MRMIVIAGLATLLGACTATPAENSRLTEARSIARQFAESSIDLSIASLSRSGVLGDIDCSQETGVDAEQCVAFTSLLESRMEPLKAAERKAAMADAADEIEALAVAITNLSDADFSALRVNTNLPKDSDAFQSLSKEGQVLIREPLFALSASLSASDQRAGDSVQTLLMEILTGSGTDTALP
jgi:hypothetical protein